MAGTSDEPFVWPKIVGPEDEGYGDGLGNGQRKNAFERVYPDTAAQYSKECRTLYCHVKVSAGMILCAGHELEFWAAFGCSSTRAPPFTDPHVFWTVKGNFL